MWGKPAGLGAAFLIYTTVNYCLCFQNVVILLDRVPVTLQRREREKFLVDEFLMIYLPPEHHATACLAQGLCSPRRTTEDMSDLQLVCCDHLSPGPRSMEQMEASLLLQGPGRLAPAGQGWAKGFS